MVKFVSPSEGLVVLYGGTFDPFHKGHEAVCRALLACEQVIQLRLIPCAEPALKQGPSVDSRRRLEMLSAWRSAQDSHERIVIDPIELNRNGPSYTVDTVEEMQVQFRGSKLVFALGADAWNQLAQWHRYRRLADMVGFWVFHREGESIPIFHEGIDHRKQFLEFAHNPASSVFIDEQVAIPVSSSSLRIQRRMDHEALPASVSDYIRQNRLYSREIQPE